jgi:hypothetical protein
MLNRTGSQTEALELDADTAASVAPAAVGGQR